MVIYLPMVNCSYCHKELDREVFCNASHKVLFHRRGTKKILKLTNPDTPLQKDVAVAMNAYDNYSDWNPDPKLSKDYFTSRGSKRK